MTMTMSFADIVALTILMIMFGGVWLFGFVKGAKWGGKNRDKADKGTQVDECADNNKDVPIHETLRQNHDEANDVMYMSFADTGDSYGTEMANGLVVLRNMKTGDVTGLTIFDFTKKHECEQRSE